MVVLKELAFYHFDLEGVMIMEVLILDNFSLGECGGLVKSPFG